MKLEFDKRVVFDGSCIVSMILVTITPKRHLIEP